MKENIKKYLKTNLIAFIIGGLLISGVAVYAAITFPSNEVSYDNKTSNLNSINVQGAIDELYKTCTSITASDLIENLEEDPYECRYFFKGATPNNYIIFNNETWRILSIQCDGTIKIIKNTSVVDMNFDNGSNGISASSIKTYLVNTYYNGLNDISKSQIVSYDYNVGGPYGFTYNLSEQIERENMETWNSQIGLISVSEYVRVNTNTQQCSTVGAHRDNYTECKETNWLVNNDDWWTLTPNEDDRKRTFSIYSNGSISSSVVNNSYMGVRPVIYLKSGLTLSGTGTQSDPYTIE